MKKLITISITVAFIALCGLCIWQHERNRSNDALIRFEIQNIIGTMPSTYTEMYSLIVNYQTDPRWSKIHNVDSLITKNVSSWRTNLFISEEQGVPISNTSAYKELMLHRLKSNEEIWSYYQMHSEDFN